jgi:hypothetical protein
MCVDQINTLSDCSLELHWPLTNSSTRRLDDVDSELLTQEDIVSAAGTADHQCEQPSYLGATGGEHLDTNELRVAVRCAPDGCSAVEIGHG